MEEPATAAVLEAKRLLDTYYGNPDNLRRAATLLDEVLTRDKRNAPAYVEAARVTVMGGYIMRREFRPGTAEAYHEFLDMALQLDPKLQKAHILKAEAFDIQRDYARELASLDLAKQLGGADPWLSMGYARYQEKVGDRAAAYALYSKVEELGPGTSPEHRKAYVTSLVKLARLEPLSGNNARLKDLGAKVWRHRDPADAWSLGNMADVFVWDGLYDDAVVFGRQAIRTMNYGAGRSTLAMALYCKAAQTILDGSSGAAEPFIREARALGVERTSMMARLQEYGAGRRGLMPTLDKIVQ